MPLKSLIYFLFNKEKAPLYEDEVGNIQEGDPATYQRPDGQLAKLQHSPEGWKDTLIRYARNITYWGMFRDYTVPLKFVKDGANILKNRMWLYGVEAICYIGILRFDRLTTPYNYEDYYLSEINFTKYKQTQTGVTVEALQGGLTKVYKANETTVYEMGIQTDTEHVNIITDGGKFDFTRTFTMMQDQKAIDTDTYWLGLIQTAYEGNPGNDVSWKDVFFGSTSVYPNEDWLGRFDVVQDILIEGKIRIEYKQNITVIVRAEDNDGQTSGGTTQYNLVNQAGNTNDIKDLLISQAISMPAGHRLHIRHTMFNPVNTGHHYTILSGEIKISYAYRFQTTYTRALYPYRLIDQIVRKMSDNQFWAVSSWLEPKKDIVITSQDALRKIDGAIIKTTPMDFFTSVRTLPADASGGGAGLTFEDDKLRIERFDYFFQDEEIMDLGEVKNAELSVAEDLMFNTIKVGQEPNEYQDANGRDEPNQSQLWNTPITRIIKELSLISKYRKDSLGVDQARTNFENKTTTDNKSDNDTFFLHVETDPTPIEVTVSFVAAGNYMIAPLALNFTVGEVINLSGTANNNGAQTVVSLDVVGGGRKVELSAAVVDEANVLATLDFVDHPYFNLARPAYTAITGIPHPDEAFNVELSPKKALLSNGSMIHSCIDLMDDKLIKFQTADKNKELSTTLAGVTVTEKEDIQIGSLAARKFRPYYINFITKLPQATLAQIQAKPYGWVRFTVQGEEFKAYLFDGGFKPATLDAQTWKTLSYKDNDLTKFSLL